MNVTREALIVSGWEFYAILVAGETESRTIKCHGVEEDGIWLRFLNEDGSDGASWHVRHVVAYSEITEEEYENRRGAIRWAAP